MGRHRARREDARRPRPRPHRPAGRAARARARHARRRLRPVRRAGPLPRAGRRARRSRRRTSTRPPTSSPSTCRSPTRRAARSTPRPSRACATACAIVNAARGELIDEAALIEALQLGEGRRRGDRRLLDRAVRGPAARAGQRRRHAAPGRVDRRGAGPRRHRRRRAGGRRARGPHGRERRQHPGDQRRGRRRARAVRPAGRASSPGSRSSWPANRARIELTYHGALAERDTRLLTVSALNGAFQGRVDRQVNWVNAPLVASELGIEVSEERRRSSRDFTNLVGVTRRAATGRRRASPGRRSAARTARWLVSALGFELEMELSPLMVFFRYDDVPGVIGRVGTLFGEAERQHREHGRVAHAPRRQGADGAVDRLAGAARARRSACARRASTTPASSTSLSRAAAAGSSPSSRCMAVIAAVWLLRPLAATPLPDRSRVAGLALAVAGFALVFWASRDARRGVHAVPAAEGRRARSSSAARTASRATRCTAAVCSSSAASRSPARSRRSC